MKRLLIALGVVLGLAGGIAAALPVYGELKAALLEKLSSDPANTEARIYYNTTAHTVKFRTNSAWLTVADTTAALVNPMATTGDMIYGGVAGAATKLATGATAGLLHGGNGGVPSWSGVVSADITDGTIANADVNASAAIDGSKITAATATAYGTVTGGAVPGSTAGASIGAGYLGELKGGDASSTAATGAIRSMTAYTLTTGVWLVWGSLHYDGGSITGADLYLNVKGTRGSTVGNDKFYIRTAINGQAIIPPTIVVVASGDANKDVMIEYQPFGSGTTFYWLIRAVRVG